MAVAWPSLTDVVEREIAGYLDASSLGRFEASGRRCRRVAAAAWQQLFEGRYGRPFFDSDADAASSSYRRAFGEAMRGSALFSFRRQTVRFHASSVVASRLFSRREVCVYGRRGVGTRLGVLVVPLDDDDDDQNRRSAMRSVTEEAPVLREAPPPGVVVPLDDDGRRAWFVPAPRPLESLAFVASKVVLYSHSGETWTMDRSLTWSEVEAAAPYPRTAHHSVDVASDRYLCLVGGQTVAGGVVVDDCRVFDADRDEWAGKPSGDLAPRAKHASCVAKGRLLVGGGFGDDLPGTLDDLWFTDLGNHWRWRRVSLPPSLSGGTVERTKRKTEGRSWHLGPRDDGFLSVSHRCPPSEPDDGWTFWRCSMVPLNERHPGERRDDASLDDTSDVVEVALSSDAGVAIVAIDLASGAATHLRVVASRASPRRYFDCTCVPVGSSMLLNFGGNELTDRDWTEDRSQAHRRMRCDWIDLSRGTWGAHLDLLTGFSRVNCIACAIPNGILVATTARRQGARKNTVSEVHLDVLAWRRRTTPASSSLLPVD